LKNDVWSENMVVEKNKSIRRCDYEKMPEFWKDVVGGKRRPIWEITLKKKSIFKQKIRLDFEKVSREDFHILEIREGKDVQSWTWTTPKERLHNTRLKIEGVHSLVWYQSRGGGRLFFVWDSEATLLTLLWGYRNVLPWPPGRLPDSIRDNLRYSKEFFLTGTTLKKAQGSSREECPRRVEGERVLTVRGWTASFRLSKIRISQNMPISLGHDSN